jgi:hypothetical protein
MNAGGVKLWQSANAISSSTLAGQFMEVFQDEADSMKPEKAIRCALYQQDEYLDILPHHTIIGFALSQYSCPEGTQLVVNLIKALLSRLDKPITAPGIKSPLMNKVYILCFAISLS